MGLLIAIEGIDGSGKSTLVHGLAARLNQRGVRVTCVRRYMIAELTAQWGRLVDCDGVSRHHAALLAAADHEMGVARYVRPALARGDVVLADRYVFSHLAHFGARGIEPRLIHRFFRRSPDPDLVFYLDLSPPAALERLRPIQKPDFWEAGLDYRMGLRIGRAYQTFLQSGVNRDMLEAHFLAHQRHVRAVFDSILPPTRTRRLDASTDAGRLVDEALRILEAPPAQGQEPHRPTERRTTLLPVDSRFTR